MQPNYLIIADPDSMRYSLFRRDLLAWWQRVGVTPDIQTISWKDVCMLDGQIQHLMPARRSLLRIESPARDFSIIRELMRAGQRELGEAPSDWTEGRHGWIASPKLIFRGLRSCLLGIRASLQSQPQIMSPANPEHLALLFDKNEVSSRLADAGLPVPESFRPSGNVESMIAELKARKWEKAYVKLAYGSCASGIVVLEALWSRISGITTVKSLDGLFYNTFDVRRVDGDELVSILNFILNEDAIVQNSVTKTRIADRNFDIRVVVLASEVAAVVSRVSRHPMTNLHLGGQRGDIEECRRQIGHRNWLDAMDYCRQAAALFELPCVGIDVAFDRHTGKPFILEMNSFGDFFPNWRDAAGQTIHDREIEESARLLTE